MVSAQPERRLQSAGRAVCGNTANGIHSEPDYSQGHEMCGIAGLLTRSPGGDLEQIVSYMTDTMLTRGPDSRGVWVDPDCGVGLGQRRLAVIDLSEAGLQPMTTACGRYTITYNGEFYNARELGAELAAAGHRFRGHSDTEVFIEGCAAWGVREALERCIGMFAIGLWDAKEQELILVRDRLGIKPLYWSWQNGTLLFASELKALVAHPEFERTINRDAVASFLRHNYIPAPQTIYQSANKLEAGWMLRLRRDGEPRLERYWSLEDAVRAGREAPLECSDEEAVDALDALLGDAVERRMIADVPLGAFLSGGVDSSTIAALMQKHASERVKTFSIGFDIPGYDEAQHAAAVARHLGTEHTELYVAPEEARDVIPRLATMYDEPFSDSSQIPTFLVSRMTRQHVTVALSGDGGDELFAGYNRYAQAQFFTKRLAIAPRAVRGVAAAGLRSFTPATWDAICAGLPVLSRHGRAGDKIHKLAGVLTEDADGFYRALITHWDCPGAMVRGGQEQRHPLWQAAQDIVPDYTERMQYLDTLTYLPDDILTKVDRASMAVSLEARVPILDHRVVEFSWRLPRRMKMRDGESKWILRQLLYRYVPKHLIERPKMGFGIPLDSWLRGPLKEWAAALLEPQAIEKYGLVDPAPVQQKWVEHLSGKRNWQYLIWDVLMLQAWCEEWA